MHCAYTRTRTHQEVQSTLTFRYLLGMKQTENLILTAPIVNFSSRLELKATLGSEFPGWPSLALPSLFAPPPLRDSWIMFTYQSPNSRISNGVHSEYQPVTNQEYFYSKTRKQHVKAG